MKDELIDEIVKLYSKIESVKDYYQTKLCPESEEQVVEKYKVQGLRAKKARA